MPQAEVSARSLRLQWVPGSDGASPIRYLTVQVRELPEGQWQTYSSSISHEATACTVDRYRACQEDPPPAQELGLRHLGSRLCPPQSAAAHRAGSPCDPSRCTTETLRLFF